jgi:hypothetical protein
LLLLALSIFLTRAPQPQDFLRGGEPAPVATASWDGDRGGGGDGWTPEAVARLVGLSSAGASATAVSRAGAGAGEDRSGLVDATRGDVAAASGLKEALRARRAARGGGQGLSVSSSLGRSMCDLLASFFFFKFFKIFIISFSVWVKKAHTVIQPLPRSLRRARGWRPSTPPTRFTSPL